MPDNNGREALFNHWSQTYQDDVSDGEFPFIGYEQTLDCLIQAAELQPIHKVLDLGIGTGALGVRLSIPPGQLWGVDFSAAMLDKAAEVLPEAHLLQLDLLSDEWPEEIHQPFNRIISGYTFHEFTDEQKLAVLKSLVADHLADDGVVLIADISFQTQAAFRVGFQRFANQWDDSEFYWCAETMIPQMEVLGLKVQYTQTSDCAGIYKIQKS
ncbi:class I SAM-dependent methyltransferase [Chloroflexota bacterium]|nr:class I SAM-dependent methyltransferase [Chloroflexota bacterium]